MSVLLTGFPGFIGARLLPRLRELSPEETFVCLVQERFLDVARRELAAIEVGLPAARGRLSAAGTSRPRRASACCRQRVMPAPESVSVPSRSKKMFKPPFRPSRVATTW